MKLITRSHYMNKLISVIGTPDIKVITGVRRSGKSKMMESFMDYISENRPGANIIHINFNLPEFDDLREYRTLYDYVNERFRPGVENFVFIDEVQMCDGFERAVNGFHASEKFDIYITGSNAFLLSSDLATLFTGRTMEIKVYPFSFGEYLKYFGCENRYDAFENYVLEGGMAGSYPYDDIELKYDYIAELFNTIILRDIRQKYNIKNIALMDRIVDFLSDNISNLSSARKIANSLEEKTNHVTVGAYIRYLCDAFAFYRVRRFDIKGKRYLVESEKYYLSDHAFRYAKLGTKNPDYGRMLENIVAVELLRRGYEVYAGVLYEKEIDFVAIKRNEKIYIQVSDDISEKKTFEREVSPLLSIRDAYPKKVITRIRHSGYTYEGAEVIDIADWLANFEY
ncbi:MAG: ATP-binding protein [Abditibacteriota bacterium]|nr:ATP-binding protein [Abditibacteriota bacterium]